MIFHHVNSLRAVCLQVVVWGSHLAWQVHRRTFLAWTNTNASTMIIHTTMDVSIPIPSPHWSFLLPRWILYLYPSRHWRSIPAPSWPTRTWTTTSTGANRHRRHRTTNLTTINTTTTTTTSAHVRLRPAARVQVPPQPQMHWLPLPIL